MLRIIALAELKIVKNIFHLIRQKVYKINEENLVIFCIVNDDDKHSIFDVMLFENCVYHFDELQIDVWVFHVLKSQKHLMITSCFINEEDVYRQIKLSIRCRSTIQSQRDLRIVVKQLIQQQLLNLRTSFHDVILDNECAEKLYRLIETTKHSQSFHVLRRSKR